MSSQPPDIYNNETGMLSIATDEMEAEFKIATRQAIENNEAEFEFYGYIVDTATAIDVVRAMAEVRTYH